MARLAGAAGAVLVLIVAVVVSAGIAAAPNKPKTSLVSRESRGAGGAGGDDSAENPSISGSGRFVVFDTEARNLGGPIQTGPNGQNIYLYDREERKVRLISRQSKSAGGAGGDDNSGQPVISASGRFVVFDSDADNLGGPADTSVGNIYVYDRKRKRVELVSRQSRSAGGAGGDGQSFDATISADGRFVSFTTNARNLGGPLANAPTALNVYVYDRKRDETQLVSRQSSSQGDAGGNNDSFQSSISADGRFVAFGTRSTNLGGPLQTEPSENSVYVYDRAKRKVQLVSRQSKAAGGLGADGSSSISAESSISADGRFVAFNTNAPNLGGPVQTGANEDNVYVYDRKLKRVTLVSRRSKSQGGAGADGSSNAPTLSPTGRFVAFETDAGNLGGPKNPANAGDDDVYVYDRKLKRVQLVSRRSGKRGAGCDDACEDPSVSSTARFIAFTAEADNLGGPIDPDAFSNVYVRDRGR